MSMHYDVAIIGAGAMGSAAAYHLSKTGKKYWYLTSLNHRIPTAHHMARAALSGRLILKARFMFRWCNRLMFYGRNWNRHQANSCS